MKRLIVTILALQCWSAAFAGDPSSDTIAQLTAVWNQVDSITGRVTLRQKPVGGKVYGFVAEGAATYCKRDGKVLTRQMLRYESDDHQATYAITNIYDGDVQWVERPGLKGMEIYKMPRMADPSDFPAHSDWSALFRELEKTSRVVWQDDETVNGEPTYVLDVTPRELVPDNPVRTTRSYFSKRYAIPVKAVAFDEHGDVVYEWAFAIESVNKSIPPETFQVTIPENAEVHDLTEAGDDR